MLVLAADHIIINNQPVFHDAIRVAEQYADEGHLVTFGIVPNAPETGYGYIQRGVALTDSAHPVPVARFVEKTGSRARRGLPRLLRGVLLEQRHVYVPRKKYLRAGQIPPGYPRSLPGRGECRRQQQRLHQHSA